MVTLVRKENNGDGPVAAKPLKTIEGNGAYEKNITIPSFGENDHR